MRHPLAMEVFDGVYYAPRTGHGIVFGNPRTGKSKWIETRVALDILDTEFPKHVIMIDPGPDPALFARVVWATHEAIKKGVKKKLFVVGDFPKSLRIKPFYKMTPSEIANIIYELTPENEKTTYFRDKAYEFALVVSSAILESGGGVDFFTFIRYASKDALEELKSNTINYIKDPQVAVLLEQWAKASEKRIEEDLSGMKSALLKLTQGKAKEIFSGNTDPVREILLENPKDYTFTFYIGYSKKSELEAKAIAKMILKSIDKVIAEMLEKYEKFHNLLAVWIDECHNAVFKGFDDQLLLYGKSNTSFMLATQTFSNLDKIDPTQNLRKNLLSATGLQVYFKVSELTTQEYVSKLSGTKRVFRKMMDGDEIRLIEEEVEVFKPEDIGRLKVGEFIAFIHGKPYKAFNDTTRFPQVKVHLPDGRTIGALR